MTARGWMWARLKQGEEEEAPRTGKAVLPRLAYPRTFGKEKVGNQLLLSLPMPDFFNSSLVWFSIQLFIFIQQFKFIQQSVFVQLFGVCLT